MTLSLPMRLTSAQMSVIWPGLDFVVRAYVAHREKKTALFAYPFTLYPPPNGFNRGTYDAGMMDQVTAIWKRLVSKVDVGGRAQMNAIEIRAAIFAVRLNLAMWRMRKNNSRVRRWDTITKLRMNVDQRSLESLYRKSKRTIASLERHMKQANRLLRAAVADEGYKALIQVWQQHLRWMRLHLAYLQPLPPVTRPKRRHQQNLGILMDMAVDGLRNKGYAPPDQKELRRIMRLYIRSSVRGREGITVPEMLCSPNRFSNKWYLALFVENRAELNKLT